jgi:uncharacterized membrane protein YdjX (TVP38/TMEM64 family)
MNGNGNRRLTEKQKKIFGAITIGALVLFMGVVTLLIGYPLIRFIEQPENFRAWIDGFGIWSELIFIVIFVFQVIFAIIPGEPLEVGAGYAFGFWEGSLLCIISTTLGGILVFLLVKKFGIRLVEIFFPIEKIRDLWFLRTEKRRNLTSFLVFAIPGTPKDLLCYFVGLTDMKLRTWILISAIARIPSVVTSTIAGASLGSREYLWAIVAFAATAGISIGGVLIYRKYTRRKKAQHPQDESDFE